MKICTKCKKEKELEEFSLNKNLKDGFHVYCKKCNTEYAKVRYEKDKENWKRKVRERKQMNPEGTALYDKKYQQDNKEKLTKRFHQYMKDRYKNDPCFRMTQKIRTSISNSFKKINHRKDCHTSDILGCSFKELKQHLESQFEPWMNWNNTGIKKVTEPNTYWDVDHIIPISSAKNEEEVIKLNHYTNLRPLCSYYNRYIKRNNIN